MRITKKQRWFCPECNKKRLAVVEYKNGMIKIVCSQGHIEERKSLIFSSIK